mmetsp:Transcript_160/g.295  ORF Transcript_160/g.295 Transcript_160/m.295 type:complete len:243 (+) Transcript_160:443-1171(+)
MSAESSTTMITSVCDRCRICFIDQDELLKKNGSRMKSCANCGKAWYCGKKCQKKDWKLHKKFCEGRLKDPVAVAEFSLFENWKKDYRSILDAIISALMHSDVSSTHCAVLQVRYTKCNNVPFQIISCRAIPDAILVSGAHDICDDKNNLLDIGANIPSFRGSFNLSSRRAATTFGSTYGVLGFVVCCGVPGRGAIMYCIPQLLSELPPANPAHVLRLVDLCNRGVGDWSLITANAHSTVQLH